MGETPNEGLFSRKYLRGRLQVLAGKVANISVEEAVHCEDGCSALRGRMQCTAGTDAVHCGSGCSALRLRGVKLALTSSVLYWIREKGGKAHHKGSLLVPREYLMNRKVSSL